VSRPFPARRNFLRTAWAHSAALVAALSVLIPKRAGAPQVGAEKPKIRGLSELIEYGKKMAIVGTDYRVDIAAAVVYLAV